jgi:hypothetical protein
VTAAQVDNGSNDNCGVASISLDQASFDCSQVGANTVTLTVTDTNGNVSTCTATVTVVDNIAPTALCQNVTVNLDANGNTVVTAAQVDNGSSDNCGIASLSLDQTSFTCANVGNNNVTLTVTDVNGNVSTCTATVTVVDNTAPTVFCQSVSVALDNAGNATITALDVVASATDNCGASALTYSLSQSTFTSIGSYTVTVTVTDASGNSSTCSTTVTVIDNLPPVALCQPATIYLDAQGNASITAADIDNGSNDNGGSVTLVASQTAFNCGSLGSNTVFLLVTDAAGNNTFCSTTVTVIDTIAPTAICQDITVGLDASGVASGDRL